MFMRVLSSSRMIRWPEGRKKLYIHVRANELLHFKPKRKKTFPFLLLLPQQRKPSADNMLGSEGRDQDCRGMLTAGFRQRQRHFWILLASSVFKGGGVNPGFCKNQNKSLIVCPMRASPLYTIALGDLLFNFSTLFCFFKKSLIFWWKKKRYLFIVTT